MLGWEFPPIINGGLGVACHDLSAALSDLTNITMIVPKSSPGYKLKKLNLIGLNNIDPTLFENQYEEKSYPFNYYTVPANLDPYYTQSTGKNSGSYLGSLKDALQNFNIDSLYGGDVINKVLRFANITTAVAESMNFDIIHAHDWMTMIAGMMIKQKTGKPLVIHIHSLEVDRGGPFSKGWVYELEKQGMEYADLLIPVSHFTANNIEQYYGISKEKMFVVHNGSTTVTPFQSERKYKEKTVLFVGRLTRQKGPEKFIDIAAKVLERDPDVRFVMAGVGDYFKSIIEQSSYKSLGNRFHMTGFLNSNQLRYLLSISDVYCMPSLSEPFGLSAIEAAQFNIPCVISKQSGVAEVLHGSLKFDYWDINKAADCIINLLNDPVLSKKVANDAAKDLDKISWNISAGNVINAYSTLIKN